MRALAALRTGEARCSNADSLRTFPEAVRSIAAYATPDVQAEARTILQTWLARWHNSSNRAAAAVALATIGY
jgi:hypothetical protein